MIALDIPDCTAGALAYASSGARIAGNLPNISPRAEGGSSHSSGNERGAERLAHRVNPSQIFGSIFHTCRLAIVLKSPSVNSRSVGAAVSACITVRMKSSGSGVNSTIFCSAAASASAGNTSGRSKHAPHASMIRFSGTPSLAGSTSCRATMISGAVRGLGGIDAVSLSKAAEKISGAEPTSRGISALTRLASNDPSRGTR
mmetsp:Transcript_7573/g.33406  ORF Transcript_7573/g.33406 Transcript_7573/m.33406 type:complete len:201 (-) Transcript_7573:1187-1789(-)